MELSHELAVSISEAATVRDAFGVALRRICDHAGWAAGMAWMPNTEGSDLELKAEWYEPSPPVTEFVLSSHRMTFAPDEGLPGAVWAAGSPTWMSDLSEAKAFLRGLEAEKAGLRAAAGVPVLAGSECVAVLEFFL